MRSVAFENVPSFVLTLDAAVDVPGIGAVRYDLAFGGAFYAFVDAASVGLALTPDRFRDLIVAGIAIKRAVMAARPIPHPTEPDLSFLYGTILTGGSLVTPAGTTAQLSGTAAAGSYCIVVYDVGNQTSDITYSVTVTHY